MASSKRRARVCSSSRRALAECPRSFRLDSLSLLNLKSKVNPFASWTGTCGAEACSLSADLVRAISRAIKHVRSGAHDPIKAHEQLKEMYSWADVAERTEKVYYGAMAVPEVPVIERLRRSATLAPCFVPRLMLSMQVLRNGLHLWQDALLDHLRRLHPPRLPGLLLPSPHDRPRATVLAGKVEGGECWRARLCCPPTNNLVYRFAKKRRASTSESSHQSSPPRWPYLFVKSFSNCFKSHLTSKQRHPNTLYAE